MIDDSSKEVHRLVEEFVELYCDLVKVNRKIGLWDLRRNQESLKEMDDIDKEYIVKTERLGRKYVEKRAYLKNDIEYTFSELLKYKTIQN